MYFKNLLAFNFLIKPYILKKEILCVEYERLGGRTKIYQDFIEDGKVNHKNRIIILLAKDKWQVIEITVIDKHFDTGAEI